MLQNRLLKTLVMMGVFSSCLGLLAAEGGAVTGRDKPVRVTLQLKQVPLRQALKLISQQARAEIVFSDNVVRDLQVTVDFVELLVENALAEILAATPVDFRKTEDNHYVLFQRLVENTERRKITGVIVDSQTNKPLAKANISLIGSKSGATTDAIGHFSLDPFSSSACTVRVAYIGYASQTVAIPAGHQSQKLHIKLEPILLQTPAITVEHNRRAVIDMSSDLGNPLAVSGESLDRLPGAVGEDLLKAAEFLPGISRAKDARSGPYIRGGTPSQTIVLFDGIPIYHHGHSFGLLSAFSTDLMQDLRLYKGVLPAKYGGRLSGLMELNAKAGDFKRFRMGSNTNLTGASLSTEIPLAGKGSWLFSARRSYSGYMVHNLHNQIFNNEVEVNRQSFAATNSTANQRPSPSLHYTESNPQLDFYDWIHRVTLTPTSRDHISLTMFRSHDELAASRRITESLPLPSDSLHAELDFSGDQTKNETNSVGYGGKWSRKWGNRFGSTAQFAVSEFASEYRERFLYPNSYDAPQSVDQRSFALEDAAFGSDRVLNKVKEHIFSLDNEVRAGTSHELNFGMELRHTSVRDSSEMTSGGMVMESARQRTTAFQTSFYVQDSWRMNSRLQTDAGLRVFAYGPTSQLFLEPRFNLRYSLSERLSLRTAWGQSTQAFNMVPSEIQNGGSNNLWVLAQGGENGLAPARAMDYTLGGQFNSGSWMLDLELYYKMSTDLTEYRLPITEDMAGKGNPGLLQGSGTSSGFDLLLQWRRSDLFGWMSYSFNQSSIRYPDYPGLGSFPADEDTPHTLRLSGNYTRGEWDFSFTWSFASGRPYTTPDFKAFFDRENGLVLELASPRDRNDRRLPDNHNLDVRLSRKFSTKFVRGEWAISLLNVYDRQNSWYRYYIVSVGRRVPVDVRTLGFVPMVSAKLQLN